MCSGRTLVLTIEGENSPSATSLIILYLLSRFDWCEIQVLTIGIQEIGCRSDGPICWADYRFFVTCHRTFPSVPSYNHMSHAAVEILIQVQIKFALQNSTIYLTRSYVICKIKFQLMGFSHLRCPFCMGVCLVEIIKVGHGNYVGQFESEMPTQFLSFKCQLVKSNEKERHSFTILACITLLSLFSVSDQGLPTEY